MSARIIVAASVLGAVLATGDATQAVPARQWAIVYLSEPTQIGSTIVQGPVLFTHDHDKMMRGEPCTTVSLFEPENGPAEEVASFQCIPKARRIASRFIVRTRPNDDVGYGCVLTEYQFAGDAEGHGVPLPVRTH